MSMAGHSISVGAEGQTSLERLRDILEERVSGEDVYPLASIQNAYWIFSQLHPDVPLHGVSFEIALRGPLDEKQLSLALNEVVRRNAILRTYFPVRDEGPGQTVSREWPADLLEKVDLSDVAPDRRESAARELIVADAREVFAPKERIPFRARLLRLEARHHILVVSAHHIIMDGRSIPIFARKLAEAYRHFEKNSEADPRPVENFQYADFTIWERERGQAGDFAGSLEYWRRQLEGAPRKVTLPRDFERPPATAFAGDRVSLNIDGEDFAGLERLTRREGVTLFCLCLTALAVCYSRVGGQNDVVIGTGLDNRNRPELADMLGDLTNFLALRIRVSETEAFRDCLRRARETIITGFEHGQTPFASVVDALGVARGSRSNPLYNTDFLLHDEDWLYPELDFGPGIIPEPRFKNRDLAGTTPLDLRFELTKSKTGLLVELEYAADRFTPATARELLYYYRRILSAVIAEPGILPGALPGWRSSEGTEPAVATARPVRSEPESSPNLYEARILQAWRRVLGTEEIETDANFFGLGGNSLQALQLLQSNDIKEPLNIQDILNNPTPAGLADLILTRKLDERRRETGEDVEALVRAIAALSPEELDLHLLAARTKESGGSR